MPCNHRFQNDLQLQYVDWEVKTLFIGTFNPEWNACANNTAAWFYGRTSRNAFWSILPTLHGEDSLTEGDRNTWIAFCRRHGIAVTDILFSLNNADVHNPQHRDYVCGFKDEHLAEFDVTINNIPYLLDHHQYVKQICLTVRRYLSSGKTAS